MTCEATIEGSKAPVTEPKKCNPNQHLEGTTCVANTKQVACDNTNINSANGTVSNNQVTITRSNGRWPAPEKCTLNCNAGYEKKTDPVTHRESCEKKSGQQSAEHTPPRTVFIVKCDDTPTDIYFKRKGDAKEQIKNYSLTRNDSVHDTYYAIVNEAILPYDVQTTLSGFGTRDALNLNMGEGDLDKIRTRFKLTTNDTIFTYTCNIPSPYRP